MTQKNKLHPLLVLRISVLPDLVNSSEDHSLSSDILVNVRSPCQQSFQCLGWPLEPARQFPCKCSLISQCLFGTHTHTHRELGSGIQWDLVWVGFLFSVAQPGCCLSLWHSYIPSYSTTLFQLTYGSGNFPLSIYLPVTSHSSTCIFLPPALSHCLFPLHGKPIKFQSHVLITFPMPGTQLCSTQKCKHHERLVLSPE